MIPATLNLYIRQGADFLLSITVFEGEEIRTTADVQAGATTIQVEPILQAIPSDRKIQFCDRRVVLSAAVGMGATELPIVASQLPIPKKSCGRLVADLTGCTATSKFSGKLLTETSPIGFTTEFDADPLSGSLSLKLSHAQTSLLPANLTAGNSLSDDELQERQLQTNDYLWDLDITFADSRIETPLKGLLVVDPDV